MARIITAVEKCATCGRFLHSRTTLRGQLLELADGTRTMHELMEATGCARGTIYVACSTLRKEGNKVKIKRIVREVLTRSEFNHLKMLRAQGLSWARIGQLEQVNGNRLYKHFVRACSIFGDPDPGPNSRKRDPVRDWMVMHQLRDDAQLPWRMVAPAVGKSQNTVKAYYQQLRQVYLPDA